MPTGPQLDYQAVCAFVGQLFLETRHELERLGQQVRDLTQRLAAAEKDRDAAVAALARPKE